MPFTIIDLDGGLGNHIFGQGVVTGEEYVAAVGPHLDKDPEQFAKYRYSIFDLTGASEVRMSSYDLQVIAGLSAVALPKNPDALVAIVGTGKLVFGFTRMWQLLQGGHHWESKFFGTLDGAKEWILERGEEKFGHSAFRFSQEGEAAAVGSEPK